MASIDIERLKREARGGDLTAAQVLLEHATRRDDLELHDFLRGVRNACMADLSARLHQWKEMRIWHGGMTLRLLDCGPKKIQCIKLVRQYTRLGLKEAKYLSDNAPITFPTPMNNLITLDEAIKAFVDIGARVTKDIFTETKAKQFYEAFHAFHTARGW
jgi:ribosomal protein L7/L12